MIKILNILMVITLLFFCSCMPEKYDETIQIWDLEVRLLNNDTTLNMNQVEVTLTNVSSGLKVASLSDYNGLTQFENIVKGEYIISAQKALEINGESMILAGSRSDISISEQQKEVTLPVNTFSRGGVVIKEVFYTSSHTPEGLGYLSDQFIEIFNNSNETIYTDSLCFGVLYGGSGQSSTSPSIFTSDTSHLYLLNIWMIPGSGKEYPLLPGQSVVIAQDAINHSTNPAGNPNSIDLSHADWETFMENPDNQVDINYAETPDLDHYLDHSKNYHDWIWNPYGVSLVIFRIKNKHLIKRVLKPNDEKLRKLITIPSDWAIDGFESLALPGKGEYKKLPALIDNSYCYCSSIYNLQSCRRKSIVDKDGNRLLIDSNSSYADFEIISKPTPGSFK